MPGQSGSGRRPVEILQSIVKLYREVLNVDFEQYFLPPLQEQDITTEMREIFPEYMLDIYRWHNGYDQGSAPLECYYFIIDGEFSYNFLNAGLSLNCLYERQEADEHEGGTWRKDIISIFSSCAGLHLGLNTTTGKIAAIPDSWSFPRVEDIEPEDWVDFVDFLEKNEMQLKAGKVVMTWDGGKLKEVAEYEAEQMEVSDREDGANPKDSVEDELKQRLEQVEISKQGSNLL